MPPALVSLCFSEAPEEESNPFDHCRMALTKSVDVQTNPMMQLFGSLQHLLVMVDVCSLVTVREEIGNSKKIVKYILIVSVQLFL